MTASHKAFEHFIKTGRTDYESNMNDKAQRAASLLSPKTGLKASTCEDLLTQGWTYVEELGKPPTWVHPMSQLGNLIQPEQDPYT